MWLTTALLSIAAGGRSVGFSSSDSRSFGRSLKSLRCADFSNVSYNDAVNSPRTATARLGTYYLSIHCHLLLGSIILHLFFLELLLGPTPPTIQYTQYIFAPSDVGRTLSLRHVE